MNKKYVAVVQENDIKIIRIINIGEKINNKYIVYWERYNEKYEDTVLESNIYELQTNESVFCCFDSMVNEILRQQYLWLKEHNIKDNHFYGDIVSLFNKEQYGVLSNWTGQYEFRKFEEV